MTNIRHTTYLALLWRTNEKVTFGANIKRYWNDSKTSINFGYRHLLHDSKDFGKLYHKGKFQDSIMFWSLGWKGYRVRWNACVGMKSISDIKSLHNNGYTGIRLDYTA